MVDIVRVTGCGSSFTTLLRPSEVYPPIEAGKLMGYWPNMPFIDSVMPLRNVHLKKQREQPQLEIVELAEIEIEVSGTVRYYGIKKKSWCWARCPPTLQIPSVQYSAIAFTANAQVTAGLETLLQAL